MQTEGSDGPWWVHCRCGAINGEYLTVAEADAAVAAHPPMDRRCSEISMSTCRPGQGFMPAFLLGGNSCDEAEVDWDTDGRWLVVCSCGALDGLRFLTHEEAEDAMDDHLDAEDDRSRALFDRLDGEGLEGLLRRG